jgi:hypothetical protein
VRPIRWQLLVAVVAGALALGCSGSREKGKNSDLDRPKPTEKK